MVQAILMVLVFWGAVIALIVQRVHHPPKRSRAEKIILRLLGGVVGAVLLCGIVFLGSQLWKSVVRQKVQSANYEARLASDWFRSARYDLDKAELLPRSSEEIYTGVYGEDTSAPTIPALMNHYGKGSRGGYYVIVTDGKWNVIYTLWSREPIPPEDIHPYTLDEQKARADLWHRQPYIGFWNVQEE